MRLESGEMLPEGWRWVAMKEVCELNPRRPAIDCSDSMPTTFVPMEAVDDVMGKMDTSATRPYSVVKKGYTYFQEGDVVFSKITPCMQNGKHAIAHGLLDGIAFGTTEFHVIRPGPEIDAHWLHSYLRRPEILREAERHFTGAVGQRRVPISFLEELEIPLPPLPEQKRIAAILTERLAAVEQARKASEARLEAARALPAAYLREVFESEEARGWPEVLLGDVLLCIEAGKSFQTGEIQACENELGVLKVSAVTWSSFKPDEAKVVNDYEPESHHRVCNGDLLISRANTKELVGAAVLVNKDYPLRLLSDKTLRLVVDPEQADKLYLLHSLRSSPARKHIEHFATGTSDSMRNISQGVIKSTPIRLPDLNTQRRIAGYFYTKNKSADDASIAIQEQLIEIKRLASSLLRQAFSGAL